MTGVVAGSRGPSKCRTGQEESTSMEPNLTPAQMRALDVLAAPLRANAGPREGHGQWRSLSGSSASTRAALVRRGLAERHPESAGFDQITHYAYRLTDAGREAANQIPTALRAEWNHARQVADQARQTRIRRYAHHQQKPG